MVLTLTLNRLMHMIIKLGTKMNKNPKEILYGNDANQLSTAQRDNGVAITEASKTSIRKSLFR